MRAFTHHYFLKSFFFFLWPFSCYLQAPLLIRRAEILSERYAKLAFTSTEPTIYSTTLGKHSLDY